MLVRTGAVDPGVPLLSATDAARLDTAANELAAGLDHATVLPLDFAVDGTREQAGRPAAAAGTDRLTLGRPVGSHTIRDVGLLYVATPALADRLGVDLSSIGSNIDLVTPQAGALFIANTAHPADTRSRRAPSNASRRSRTRLRRRTSSRRPACARHGLRATRGGWLIESASPLTAAQLTTARQRAAAAGLTIETRRNQDGLHTAAEGRDGRRHAARTRDPRDDRRPHPQRSGS